MQKRKAAKEVFMEQQKSKVQAFGNTYPNEPISNEYEEEFSQNAPVPIQENIASAPSQTMYFAKEELEKKQPPVRKPMPQEIHPKIPNLDIKTSEELQLEKEPIRVKITGYWRWKRVIVPPNAFVVHTRINRKEPVTIGQGISFRYNPFTDAYLVIPAAMQTIGVVANCISKEKQGINVLAYVQWQIGDFAIAYKKLDFNNSFDPLGIVNAQLMEQAEAAIKDKIATMSVDEVLTDKAPVIEELTSRMREVAEGKEGLGIKIITVQIREALVSSTSLWTDLQSPFRNEQKQKARISYLEMENEINKKEQQTRRLKEVLEAETNHEIEKIKQGKQTEIVELRLGEEAKRFEEEQKNLQKKRELEEATILKEKETRDRIITIEREITLKQKLEELKQKEKIDEEDNRIALELEKRQIALETEKELFAISEEIRIQKNRQESIAKKIETDLLLAEKESDLLKLQTKFDNQVEALKQEAELERSKKRKEIEMELKSKEDELKYKFEELLTNIEAIRQEIKNSISVNHLTSELIKELPQIASCMPEIKDLHVFQSDGSDPFIENLSSFVAKILSLTQALGKKEKAES